MMKRVNWFLLVAFALRHYFLESDPVRGRSSRAA